MDTEIEHGTCARTTLRRHNGYFAGDFSQSRPMSSAGLNDLLRDLTALRRAWTIVEGPRRVSAPVGRQGA